jgi:hypothetical protein
MRGSRRCEVIIEGWGTLRDFEEGKTLRRFEEGKTLRGLLLYLYMYLLFSRMVMKG